MADKNPNAPPRPLRVPAQRHVASRVGLRTLHRANNAVVESRVDMRVDIDAINRGAAVRDGNDFTVNGRTYRMKPDGGSFPIGGDGVHLLDRAAYRALGVYNALGATPAAERVLDRLRIDIEPRKAALFVWRMDRGLR